MMMENNKYIAILGVKIWPICMLLLLLPLTCKASNCQQDNSKENIIQIQDLAFFPPVRHVHNCTLLQSNQLEGSEEYCQCGEKLGRSSSF